MRKYSGEQGLIWGDNHCEHQWGEQLLAKQSGGGLALGGNLTGGDKNWDLGYRSQGNFCSLCGAWKGAYGLEPTPEMYIEHTIEILREIRRVLRKDGVVFWNVGDSYAANRSYQVTDSKWRDVGNTKGSRVPKGLKPKDLCLIPFRVAIAAQEDGWWVRSVIYIFCCFGKPLSDNSSNSSNGTNPVGLNKVTQDQTSNKHPQAPPVAFNLSGVYFAPNDPSYSITASHPA